MWPAYYPEESTAHFIHELLEEARSRGKEAQLAQYLVGAKLQLRFPEEAIDNYSYSTADQ
jgi:ubiquinone/menaquinone biosynthesis C-methylase UbiE